MKQKVFFCSQVLVNEELSAATKIKNSGILWMGWVVGVSQAMNTEEKFPFEAFLRNDKLCVVGWEFE